MNPRALFIAALLFAVARAEDAPDAAFNQWKSAWDEADKRVGASGRLRDALNEAARDRYKMSELAGSCRDRVSSLDSAKFKEKFQKEEVESARREVKRLSDLKDQRYDELMSREKSKHDKESADILARDEVWKPKWAAHDAESKRINEWDARIEAWRVRVKEWYARVDAMSKIEGPEYNAYLAAYNEYKAEEDRFNADVNSINRDKEAWRAAETQLRDENASVRADWDKSEESWTARLKEIEAFVVEEGKPVLAAQAIASKKEQEYEEAVAKLEDLEEKQSEETGSLSALVSSAGAMLAVVVEALNAPPPTPASVAAAAKEPWAVRNEETAKAVAVAPAPADPGSAPPMRSRILVLPPAQDAANPAAADADRLRAQLQAEALAGQYVPVPEVKAAPVPPPDGPSLARAPEGFLGPAPVGYSGAFDDSSAVVVLSDEDLHRVVDPRLFISDLEYRRALETRNRFAGLVPKLEAQIARLRQQRDKSFGYSQEFEEMRAEIACGALREALGTYSAAFKNLRLAGNLKYLTPEKVERLERAFDLVKLGLAPVHAGMTKEEIEKRNLQGKSLEEGAAMITEIIAANSGNKDVEAILGAAGNVMKGYGEINRYISDPQLATRPKWEEIGQFVKTDLEITGNFIPVVALGVAIEGTGERALQWHLTREAVTTLNASLKSTDDAIIYLSDQLTRTQLRLDQATATIGNYEAVDPTRRRSFHIRPPDPPPPPPPADEKRVGDKEFDGKRDR